MNIKMRSTQTLVLLVLSLVAAGCPHSSGAPVINSFTATPATIHSGQKSTLAWDVTGASSISIDQNVGVQLGHSVDVSPTANTTYTLSATGLGGTTTAQVTVTVLPALPLPVISNFIANPSSVATNTQTTLSWTVTAPAGHPVTSLSITDGTSTQDVTSKTSVVWTVGSAPSYTFVLTATNDGGSVTAQTPPVTTHAHVLHLQYTDPANSTAKILLVRNSTSTDARLVLDVKVASTASAITAFGFAMNIPVLQESNGMYALDTNSVVAPGLLSGGAINAGTSPVTGAIFLSGPTSAMPNVLSIGVAKHKNAATDGDDTWNPGATLFSMAFTMTASASDGHSVFLGTTAMADPKFRAAALTKAGAEAVSKQDIAIGDLVISL